MNRDLDQNPAGYRFTRRCLDGDWRGGLSPEALAEALELSSQPDDLKRKGKNWNGSYVEHSGTEGLWNYKPLGVDDCNSLIKRYPIPSPQLCSYSSRGLTIIGDFVVTEWNVGTFDLSHTWCNLTELYLAGLRRTRSGAEPLCICPYSWYGFNGWI